MAAAAVTAVAAAAAAGAVGAPHTGPGAVVVAVVVVHYIKKI